VRPLATEGFGRLSSFTHAMSLFGVRVLVMTASFAVAAATGAEKGTAQMLGVEDICDEGVRPNVMLLQTNIAMHGLATEKQEDMRNTNKDMVEKNSEKGMQHKDDVCSVCGSGYRCYDESLYNIVSSCRRMLAKTSDCTGTVCSDGASLDATTTTTTTTAEYHVCSLCGSGYRCYDASWYKMFSRCSQMLDKTSDCTGTVCSDGASLDAATTTTTTTTTADVCSECGSGYKCFSSNPLLSSACSTMSDETSDCFGTVCFSGETVEITTTTTTTTAPQFISSEGGNR